jgi:hypothetical protein
MVSGESEEEGKGVMEKKTHLGRNDPNAFCGILENKN